MTFDRRTFLIGAGSGLSLLVLSACTPEGPQPVPSSSSPTPTGTPGVTEPAAFLRSNWSEDQFARGALSFVYVGSSTIHREALATPIDNRVFFAGEATSIDNPGTVAGARASGTRAAAEVAAVGLPGEKVTVIGAGAAGAEAAKMLGVYGFEVTVIEARDRTGGRIDTVTGSDWPIPAELGAWLLRQDADADLADQLRALGIGSVQLGSAEERDAGGVIVADAASASQLFGIDPGEASRIVTGGYVGVVTDALGDTETFLSTAVTAIAHDDDSVSVRLGTGESLTTDRVVVTVPLGVLQAGGIEFAPPLPDEHDTAINALGFGTVDSVWLRFDEPFWTTDATVWLVTGTDDDLTTWINLEPLTGDPVLVALVGGDAALRIAQLDDDAVQAAAMTALAPFAF
jgi:monoamine oxidase